MKVAVYAIAKNEEGFASRFAETTAAADVRIVVDTGSTDRTVGCLRQHGVQVTSKVRIHPFRFDTARNIALSLVPEDVDWCIALDLDELLSEGWRDRLDELGTRKTVLYKWDPPSFDPEKLHERVMRDAWIPDRQVRFIDDRRIHRRWGYQWRYPCHEELYSYGGAEDELVDSSIEIEHRPDLSKPRTGYLDLLVPAAREEYPHSERMAFYYARELCYRKMYDEAVDFFRQAAQRQLAY